MKVRKRLGNQRGLTQSRFRPSAVHGHKSQRFARRDLHVEPLEARLLLASDVTLTGSVLALTDNVGEPNRVTMNVVNGGTEVELTDVAGIVPDGSQTFFNGTDTVRYALAGINAVGIVAGVEADAIGLLATPSGVSTTVEAGDGNDTINIGSANNSLAGIRGGVQVFGDAHDAEPTTTQSVSATGRTVSLTLPVGDKLNVRDHGHAAAAQYAVTDFSVQRQGIPVIIYRTIESLELLAGSGSSEVKVFSANRIVTTINTGDGVDGVTVTSTNESSLLMIDTGPQVDDVRVEDTGNESVTVMETGSDADTITLVNSGAGSGTRIRGNGGNDRIIVVAVGEDSTTSVEGDEDGDNTDVSKIPASSGIDVSGGPGDDLTRLSDAGSLDSLWGSVLVRGQDGNDELKLDDATDGDSNQYVIDATTIVRNAGQVIRYGGVEMLQLFAGGQPDRVLIHPSTDTTYALDGAAPSGPPGTLPGDTLEVNVSGVTDPNVPADVTSGVITSSSHRPIEFSDFENVTEVLPVELDPDRLEPNATIDTATALGSIPEITLPHLTVHSSTDIDLFQYTANRTGYVVIAALFDGMLGNIGVRLRDADGDVIAESQTAPGGSTLATPVISRQMYFVEVFGFQGATNSYALEIENFAAPSPTAVILDANDDSGMSNSDEVTSAETARVVIQADLSVFEGLGIAVLDADSAEAQQTGAAVEVFVNGASAGIASPLFNSRFFQFEFEAGDLASTGLPIGFPGATSAFGFMNVVSAAVRVIDGQPNSGTSQLSPTLVITFDSTAPDASAMTLDLLDASDSGNAAADAVTNKTQPAFGGVAESNSKVRLFANRELVGQTVAGPDATDGTLGDGLGAWETTAEPLDEGEYTITVAAEDLAGNISDPAAAPALEIVVDTIEPNTPYLDLLSDSGRSDTDNVTNAANPTIAVTINDTFEGNGNPEPHDVIYRIYDRPGDGDGEVLLIDSFSLDGDFVSGGFFAHTLSQQLNDPDGPPLHDGVHNLKLEVEDRAGNISHDFLIDVVIDTQPFLGQGRLDFDSDTGVEGFAETMIDRITSDKSPAFFGIAEANNLVIVRIDGLRSGTATAVPLDGNDAFQPPDPPNAPVQGNWQVEANVNLEEGEHTAVFTFEDVAGNQVTSQPTRFFVDTQGPRVSNATYGDVSRGGNFEFGENTTSLFRPKPDGGPDPLISSIVVHFTDGPARTPAFRYDALLEALAEEEGHYQLVGDASGPIPILDVIATYTTVTDQEAIATVELVFHDPVDGVLLNGDDVGSPLPDDRYTLTVSDSLADPAGNALDGESAGASPFTGSNAPDDSPPVFPSGDGRPGGSFEARFTVDSRPEIGVYASGSVSVDTNGNFGFDPDGTDFSNRDIVYTLGFTSDDVFAGNFATDASDAADGYDKLAAYGHVDRSFRWLVDTDNDGVPDVSHADPANINGLPVAGRFDDSDDNGDEVGVFTGRTWYFDTDHDFEVDQRLNTRLVGYPAVGDVDGDGFDDLVTWTDNTFQVDLAGGMLRGWDGIVDAQFVFGFIGVRERPVAADLDQDGFDDLGLWVPDRAGGGPAGIGQWYFLVSGGDPVLDRIVAGPDRGSPVIPFTPVPFGNDIFAQFGDEYALPVLGNFDPPTVPSGLITTEQGEQSIDLPDNLDVNRDGFVTPLDALFIANRLNRESPSATAQSVESDSHYDVNRDGLVSPVDVLLVANRINELAAARGPVTLRADPANRSTETTESFLAGMPSGAKACSGAADDRTRDAVFNNLGDDVHAIKDGA